MIGEAVNSKSATREFSFLSPNKWRCTRPALTAAPEAPRSRSALRCFGYSVSFHNWTFTHPHRRIVIEIALHDASFLNRNVARSALVSAYTTAP